MRRSLPQQVAYALSLVLAAAPFAYGLTGLLDAHYDLRKVSMAVAALFGAGAVIVFGEVRGRKAGANFAMSSLILVLSILLAGGAAVLLEDTEPFDGWTVAIVLGSCCAVSYSLYSLSRPRSK
jgi:peptidoglycan/LPS O-acetylase OafA/YrhL